MQNNLSASGNIALVCSVLALGGCAAPQTQQLLEDTVAAELACSPDKAFLRAWDDEPIYLATVTLDDCSKVYFLGLEGEIDRRNLELLKIAEAGYGQRDGLPLVGVMFNSPGGNVGAAFDFANWIATNRLSTYIPRGMSCASACTIAFMAGQYRWMDEGSSFGIHSTYGPDGRPSPAGNELAGVLVTAFGGHGQAYKAIAHGTPPGDMTWLSANQAQAMNFATGVL